MKLIAQFLKTSFFVMEVGALGWVRCRLVCSQNKFKLREVNKCEVHLSKHFPIELLVC